MKKLFMMLLVLGTVMGCSSYRFRTRSEIEDYVRNIDKKVMAKKDVEVKKNGHRKLTVAEQHELPANFKGSVIVSTQDGYKNVYDGYDDHLMLNMETNMSDYPHGVYKKFDKDENLVEIGWLEEEEVRSGIIREYYPTGELKATYTLYFEKPISPVKYYNKDGSLKATYKYVDGKKVYIEEKVDHDGISIIENWKTPLQ